MKRIPVLLYVAVIALAAAPGNAWWPQGHSMVAEAAVKALPGEMPAFFRQSAGMVAHMAQDPDVAKNRAAPALSDHEGPEHYIDWELLQGRPLPARRYEFLKLCAELKADPKHVGLAPYAIAEWTERLTVAFAEHRAFPKNPHIRTKCLVYAGILSHYTGDLCMPLHTTIHHNGRLRADGSSPNTGIHEKVDSLIEKIGFKREELTRGQRIEPVAALLPAIVQEIELSRSLIDRTYALEPQLPPASGAWTPSAEMRAYTLERARAATRFTAALYLSAWRNSATVQLPPWLEREEGKLMPATKR